MTGGVSGFLGISKTGGGTLLRSGANTFTGGIGVQNGTVRMSSFSATGGTVALGGAGSKGIFIYNGAAQTTSRVIDDTWGTVESGIAGTGGQIQRFYSTLNVPKRYFRVEEDAP
ncbi:MAG: hypothetical protein V4819_00460 [Verrucomicrobiota bacterium]